MTDVFDPLTRIADALERLAPPPPVAVDPLAHPALVWRRAALFPAVRAAAQPLDALVGVDRQKEALLGNLRRHAAGHAAHDVLLWGARGSGKSALVKSAVAAVQAEGTRLSLVEVADLDTLPALFDRLAPVPRRFALFLDDLGVDAPGEARALRSLLQGGAEERPDNMRLLVTANRRHLQPRDMGENRAEHQGAINPRDAADDALALADRFGLSLGFHVVDQDGYLAMVERYAATHGLPFDLADAVGWATRRGSRSGRVAWQYAVELAGRAGRML